MFHPEPEHMNTSDVRQQPLILTERLFPISRRSSSPDGLLQALVRPGRAHAQPKVERLADARPVVHLGVEVTTEATDTHLGRHDFDLMHALVDVGSAQYARQSIPTESYLLLGTAAQLDLAKSSSRDAFYSFW